MIAVKSVSTYFLELPAKHRRYVFQILDQERVRIDKWAGGRCDESKETGRAEARKLYGWLKSIGYRTW